MENRKITVTVYNYEHILTGTFDFDPDLITPEVVDFFEECVNMTRLYAIKNHDYGNSFAKGVRDIGDAYAIGRLYDKMNRIITLSKNHDQKVLDESMHDTLEDLACYSIMYKIAKEHEKTA